VMVYESVPIRVFRPRRRGSQDWDCIAQVIVTPSGFHSTHLMEAQSSKFGVRSI